jgi:hypothetical protein
MSTTTYPVHVDAELDTRLSRWLWLFKWLLVIPHYIVLVFLWLAFIVLSVVAFFGILFTGRYPRSIFEFNVGVLRWSWRVAYYAYGALGTDRYPPFTLHEVPDYPAHLEVDYPAHLSRGLVLVKWWLLAIPHYIVVGLLVGGAGYAVRAGSDGQVVWGAGLIGLLVLVAGVLLLFTGRYPQQLFDLVLGLNRWVLRVAGYAGLMTDRYPPFSLDQGGHEDQGGARILPPAPAPLPSPQEAPPVPSSGWTGGRVVSLVLGSLLVMVAVGLGVPGVTLLAASSGARDNGGFLMSGSQSLTTSTYALSSTNIALHMDGRMFVPHAVLGDTKVSAVSRNGKDIFVGVATTRGVQEYLDGVRHATFHRMIGDQPLMTNQPGVAPSTAPGDTDIWAAKSSGPGTQTVVWPPRNGDWSVVVMNADGSAGVSVESSAGAEVPALTWVVTVTLALGTIVLVAGALLIAVPLRSVSRQNAPSR